MSEEHATDGEETRSTGDSAADSTDTGDTDETADTAGTVDTDPFQQLSTHVDTDVSDPWVELEPTTDSDYGAESTNIGGFDLGDGDASTAGFDFSAVDEWADAIADGDAALDAPNGDDATVVETDDGETYVVSKRHYCQTCPHFESPPEFGCDHEGTDIVETVGFERLRVRNCPVVDDDGDAGSSRRAAHAVADVPGSERTRRDGASGTAPTDL